MSLVVSLRKNGEFLQVYRTGKSYANRYLVMYVKESEDKDSIRIGISVSKKVGNSVVRHRIRRLVKESYRLHLGEFRTGCDIVIVARREAKDKGYREIESALLHLARLHNLII